MLFLVCLPLVFPPSRGVLLLTSRFFFSEKVSEASLPDLPSFFFFLFSKKPLPFSNRSVRSFAPPIMLVIVSTPSFQPPPSSPSLQLHSTASFPPGKISLSAVLKEAVNSSELIVVTYTEVLEVADAAAELVGIPFSHFPSAEAKSPKTTSTFSLILTW
ncbi:hypothetical protein D3C73_1230250 [compost metagenome]